MNRPLPASVRDLAPLVARVLIGVVMFAHGFKNLVIDGIGGTARSFETLGIPLSIVSAAFVTVVEFVGSVLLVVGAGTTLVSAMMLVIMVGAGVFVHIPNGIFVGDGGWELVGVIAAALIAIAAAGPGRYSLDHLLRVQKERYRRELSQAAPLGPQATGSHPVTPPARPLAISMGGGPTHPGPVPTSSPTPRPDRAANLFRTGSDPRHVPDSTNGR